MNIKNIASATKSNKHILNNYTFFCFTIKIVSLKTSKKHATSKHQTQVASAAFFLPHSLSLSAGRKAQVNFTPIFIDLALALDPNASLSGTCPLTCICGAYKKERDLNGFS